MAYYTKDAVIVPYTAINRASEKSPASPIHVLFSMNIFSPSLLFRCCNRKPDKEGRPTICCITRFDQSPMLMNNLLHDR
jgi:hypothetical protein